MKKSAIALRLLLAAALVVAGLWLLQHRELLQTAALERVLGRVGPWAPLLFVGLYALATVLFVPGSVLTITGGAMFGPWWGTLWNLSGAILGASLAFLIARYIGANWIARRAGTRLAALMRGVEAEGWRFVAFVRLVPLFPFNLVNYSFGLTGVGFGAYAAASFVCMAPGALAYTYLGYAGREAVGGGTGIINKVLLALALLAAVAFLPRLVRRLRGPQDRSIDAATLERRRQAREEIVLLDVRSPEEFHGPLGHLKGAINVPLAELPGRLPAVAAAGKPIVTI